MKNKKEMTPEEKHQEYLRKRREYYKRNQERIRKRENASIAKRRENPEWYERKKLQGRINSKANWESHFDENGEWIQVNKKDNPAAEEYMRVILEERKERNAKKEK